ncbi:large-conductance mechanosensitive channel protein MscL [Holzapfeliella sp. He02]|uniref:Large-conductance mechanosensitive channel n=1 Tax=Holzapfeliella saturejae TaxID=3082953 RepID=A0ABU8SF90_9LACO
MLKEFKQFISRGNVLDLAIGVLIGSAFSSIVTSLTKNLLNPFIGLFLGKVDLSNIQFSIAGANFLVGQFLNDVIAFLITAFVVFLIAKFFNSLRKKEEEKPKPEPKPSQEEVYLQEIRDLLKQQNK